MTAARTDSSADDQPAALSSDEAYDILADRRRRYAIHYLKQADADAVTVQTLAEQVAAWENDKSVEALTAQERKRVYISLYQSHLSTLDEEDIVTYDEDAGTVSLTGPVEQADIYLEIVPRRDIPWSYFYAGLSVAAGVLVTLRWAAVGAFSDVPPLAVAAIVVVLFAAAAVVHGVQSGRAKLGDAGPPPELSADE